MYNEQGGIMKKYVFVLSFLFAGCAATAPQMPDASDTLQAVEIADHWEPDWVYDCLENDVPEEACEPPK